MSRDRQSRVEEIFLTAVDLKAGEKTRFLDRSCADDPELRREVESLLGYHQEIEQPGGGSFMDSKAAPGRGLLTQIGATALKGDEPLLPSDRRLGQYTVQAVLGQGGMGVVYLAEQDRPRRTVALKVMRRGVGSERLVRRFEFEAEMLGKLHHPGIAQVYEAGTFRDPQTGSPHPYIAMELVRGKPLIQHAHDRGLSTRARVELVARVCDAVQHAHMCGVIHRDLKPANILVTEDGQPKILDFGVARAIDRDVAVTTIQTSVGQIIGTLPYMSPEQVAGEDDVDTRSDVYGLGVVIYELLTGRLPYQFRGQSLPEAARLIRESPPLRLSTVDRALRGDVDTIVGKALAKERVRRYQSAADLAADLRAYLDGRPIAARQDSALYVLRKQLHRYKGGVAAALVFVTSLLAFSVYANIQAGRSATMARSEQAAKQRAEGLLDEANRQRDRADAAAARVRQELAFSNIERGRLVGLSGNVAAAESLLWPEHLKNLDSYQTFYALWELYKNARSEATLRPNEPRVERVALSPDERFLATSGVEPAVMVWDTSTLSLVAQVAGSGATHPALAFSSAGVLAGGSGKGRICLWDPATGAELACVRASGPSVTEVRFDRSGERLLAATVDGMLTLFDVAGPDRTGRVIATVRLGEGPPAPLVRSTDVALNPASPEFAAGCTDATIRVYSSSDLTLIRTLPVPEEFGPRLGFSPDGSMIACTGVLRYTRVLDSTTGAVLHTLRAANGALAGTAFSPDGKNLYTIGWWYLEVWDLAREAVTKSFSLSAAGRDLMVTRDGKRIWAGISRNACAWELDPDAGSVTIPGPEAPRARMCFGRPGELLAGEFDGSVVLLSDPGGERLATLSQGERRVRTIKLNPDRSLAAAIGQDNVLRLIDLGQRCEIARWSGYKMVTNDGMAFDSTGSRMVVPVAEGGFRVLAVPSGRVLLTIPSDRWEPLAATFSPDDRLIATTTRREYLCIYDAEDGRLLRECERPGACPWTIVFTADGKQVLSGNWDRAIYVWDVATGELARRLEGHRGLVTDMAFRPREPSILASSGADGRLMLWDLSLPHNTPCLTLDGFGGWEVWSLDFDATGRWLMGLNSPGTAVMWNLRHFNRHIGGNMGEQIRLHRDALGPDFDETAAREQEQLLLRRGRAAASGSPTSVR